MKYIPINGLDSDTQQICQCGHIGGKQENSLKTWRNKVKFFTEIGIQMFLVIKDVQNDESFSQRLLVSTIKQYFFLLHLSHNSSFNCLLIGRGMLYRPQIC